MSRPGAPKEPSVVTSKLRLYGPALGGDGTGNQDYTADVQLRGVVLVDVEFLRDLMSSAEAVIKHLDSHRHAELRADYPLVNNLRTALTAAGGKI